MRRLKQATTSRPSRGASGNDRSVALLLLAMTLLTLSVGQLRAQESPPDSVAKMYGISTDTTDRFFVGAWTDAFPWSACYSTSHQPEWLSSPIAGARIDPITGDTVCTGARRSTWDTLNHYDSLWKWCDDFGIDVIRRRVEFFPGELQQLDRSPWVGDHRVIAFALGPTHFGAQGAEEEFLMVDSALFADMPMVFTWRSGGEVQNNGFENNDFGLDAGEMRYDSTNTTPGQTIAKDIAINWKPMQTHRWPQEYDAVSGQWEPNDFDSVQQSDPWSNVFGGYRGQWRDYLVVTGHLRSGGSSSDGDTLLEVIVSHETPYFAEDTVQTSRYVDTAGSAPKEPATNLTLPFDTMYVTKAELKPIGSPTEQNWDAYRTVRYPIYVKANPTTGLAGPQYAGNTSQRMNIEVRWLGGEPVVLRSVAFRDSLGDLMLGDESRPEVQQFHDSIVNVVRSYALYNKHGENGQEGGYTDRRKCVMGVAISAEFPPTAARCYQRMYKLLHDNLNAAMENTRGNPYGDAPDVDGVPAWMEGGYQNALQQEGDSTYDPNAVTVEEMMSYDGWMNRGLKLPYNEPPRLREHNGGRTDFEAEGWGTWENHVSMPELIIDTTDRQRTLDSVEVATTMYQRRFLGQYKPDSIAGYQPYGTNCDALGEGAAVARQYHRRLASVIFNVGPMGFAAAHTDDSTARPNAQWTNIHAFRDSVVDSVAHTTSIRIDTLYTSWKLDTVVGHYPEAAELWAMATTSLAYGAKGIDWQVMDGHYNSLNTRSIGFDDATWRTVVVHPDGSETSMIDSTALIDSLEIWNGVNPDFGACGPMLAYRDTTRNHYDQFLVLRHYDWRDYYDDTAGYYIPDFYTGWGVRSRATKEIDHWLHRIGPELMKLAWRNTYSINYTVPQNYTITYFPYGETAHNWDTATALERGVGYRPVPSDEIFSSVTAYRRDKILIPGLNTIGDSLVADSPEHTYVEVGLFEPRHDTTGDPMRDTNYMFLVNRRTFERPRGDYSISPTSARGRMMDSVSEMRVIDVRLNLRHPDSSQYNFVRVREIEPTTDTLPLATGPRVGLDTAIAADSSFRIALNPGHGALLEITYLPPDGTPGLRVRP